MAVDTGNLDPNESAVALGDENADPTKPGSGEWKTVTSPRKRSQRGGADAAAGGGCGTVPLQPSSSSAVAAQSSRPPMGSVGLSAGTSKLRPPQHRSGLGGINGGGGSKGFGGSRGKYVPVKSSGYGRVTRSQSAAMGSGSGYISDDCSVASIGSACSIQSTSSLVIGPGVILNESKVLSSGGGGGNGGSRKSMSAPTSPVGSRLKEFKEMRQRERSSGSRARYGSQSQSRSGSSSWAQKQREQQEQRQKRSRKIIDRSTHDKVQHSGKRSAHSPSTADSSNKTAKTSERSSPGSAKNTTTTPVSQLKQVASNLLSTFRSPTRDIQNSVTLSYAKAVAFGGTPPTIGRKLFDDKTKSMLAELSVFDPAISEAKKLSEHIFSHGTGISDDEIRKILNSKSLSTGAKQWELKKKVEAANESIKHLKGVMNMLLRGKNKFVSGAVDAERAARSGWERALRMAKIMDEERSALKKNIKQLEADSVILKDNIKDSQRNYSQMEEKVASLEAQLGPIKEKLGVAEQAHTEASIKLAVAEAQKEEAAKQAEEWRAEIANVETSKAEAIKQAQMEISSEKERDLAELREECAALKMKMEAREEELCRLVGVGASDGDGSHLDSVKQELDKLKGRTIELESQLESRESELAKARADSEAAIERAAAKDRDMSELAKGLREVQQSGQAREEEANALRKAAEAKASEIERLYTEARHEIDLMKHEKDLMTESLESIKAELASAESSLSKLKAELAEQKTEMASHHSQVHMERELRSRAEQNVEEERRERIACSAQMVAMTQEHARVQAQLKEENVGMERHWREKLEVQTQELRVKGDQFLEAKQNISGLEAELASLKTSLNDQKSMVDAKKVQEIGQLVGEINVLKERLKAEEARSTSVSVASAEQVAALEKQLREGQAERRRMHNLIQELRGNVRVFARVRPFLPSDGVGDDVQPHVVPKSESALTLLKGDRDQEFHFSFDKVFPPSVGQESVFEEVSELVQSALDGYNVCLFSYGQTGSGKTHTMQGSGNGAMRGVIPRSIQQVGNYKKELERDGWEYEMKVSFLEIYNENIRDLLREDKAAELKHDIKINSDGRRYVSDITMKDLDPNNSEAVEEVMRQAAKHRSVASTDMNAVSSRSHSVFALHLTAKHSERREALRGTLNLVDLAGSERLERSGATGARAKEAVSINKSLSCLTDVFVAIGKKAGHIPFRNSKLTYLLQPCLSGDGKTLMVVNLSPTEESAQESLCSLRFASHVNKCELGKARKQIEGVNDEGKNSVPSPAKAAGKTVKRLQSSTISAALRNKKLKFGK